MRPWVTNSSPLILLGKIGRLGLLEELAPNLHIPAAVELEVNAGPQGDPARHWIQLPKAKGYVVEEVSIPQQILVWDLGSGESAVLAVALSRPGSLCLLDDLAARRCAAALELPVCGTLGVLIRAKQAGLIPSLQAELEHLLEVGSMLAPHVIRQALHLAGEAP